MSISPTDYKEIEKNVILDGRLALFHKEDRWLALADLHFGYELSQRAAGNLFPLWGMQTIETRLAALISDYNPAHLILLGDLVHDRAGTESLGKLLKNLGNHCEIVLIAGNHDRGLGQIFDLAPMWRNRRFCFHHGHCAIANESNIQVIGHHHPASTIRDGAGLRLKLPALIQQEHCWILPAFSPWAAGTEWKQDDQEKIWLCSPQRVFQLERPGPVSGT